MGILQGLMAGFSCYVALVATFKAKEVSVYMQLHFDNFGKRFCAYVLDMCMLTVVFAILGLLNEHVNLIRPFVQTCVFYTITILYFSLMESSIHQATLGKMILGLTVCKINSEERISFGRAVVRNIARLINMPLFCVGYVIIIFTKRHQGLHDFIARTSVVDTTNEEDEGEDDDTPEDSELHQETNKNQ